MGLLGCKLRHCPPTGNMTLKQRLLPLVGRKVTVFVPDGRSYGQVEGELTSVTANRFKVEDKEFCMDALYCIALHQLPRQTMPYEVTAIAEDTQIGSIGGRLVQIGKDFIEFCPASRSCQPVLLPLHWVAELECRSLE